MGSFLGVNLGFGFGVTMGVHMAGNISGEWAGPRLTGKARCPLLAPAAHFWLSPSPSQPASCPHGLLGGRTP